ncbi:MAG: PLP-dependent aminotransferase family protein [Anaerolineales bacterium]|nr:PLP-dependent aminotransferase family protein [Anaerolineales bacterium]
MPTSWEKQYAQRTQKMSSSAIREILKVTQFPDVISFAGGLPSPDVFPIAEFKEAYDVILNEQGPQSLQYSLTEGYPPLRAYLAEETSQRIDIRISADNILITNGSQQVADLLGKVFIDPGDKILVEEPTYLGALQAWRAYQAEFVTVPTDEDGMIPAALEEKLKSNPKFIYALPTFQNPTGISYSLERRQQIVELANQYGVPIFEDDPYGRLQFEGEELPTLISLDSQYHGEACAESYQGNVIYTSTFSKILAPGIRLAWVIAPKEVTAKIVQAKQGVDLHTSTINQMVAHHVIHEGFLNKQIAMIREVYKKRRDIMMQAMQEYFPASVTWTHPKGGLFIWVTLPEGLNAAELLKIAVDQKRVAFVPGAPFYPNGGGERTCRMNFSNATEEGIREGVSRLGEVISEQLG